MTQAEKYEFDLACAEHSMRTHFLNLEADQVAREAPVVRTTPGGARIVAVDRGYVCHPDDRGAFRTRSQTQ